MSSVHALQPSCVKARHAAVTAVACMPPEQSHLIRDLLIVQFFLKGGNSSREHDRWKEEPNKTEDMPIILFLSSRLYAYGNKSNSETLEFMLDFSKITDVQGIFWGYIR